MKLTHSGWHAGYAANDGLKLSEHDIVELVNHIFFLDSTYPEISLQDADAFDAFRDWCSTNDTINRKAINQDTGDVFVVGPSDSTNICQRC